MTNPLTPNTDPFTRAEALHLWARLVAGWAQHLDPSGARTLFAGVPNAADAGGSYEGVTRMLWGLGAWFAFPDRAATLRWRGETIDLEALTIRALSAGTNPDSPGFWGRAPQRSGYDQRTVESGQVAFAAWQSRGRIWARLATHERTNLIDWLERFGQRPASWRNNWALFWALNHAARKALGERHDQATIDSALDYLEGAYCGDGWYDDATVRGPGHFDDYNLWVFGTHVAAWVLCDGATQPDRRAILLERLRTQMLHLPWFFAADGAYTEYGRSLSYKFARLGAPLLAYRLDCWPHSPGLLRRIVGRHIRWYVDRGALRTDGTLRQTLTAGGSRAVRETYISTGATYWAMLAFAGLWALPDDDPFWTAEEEPLPVEQGDFVRGGIHQIETVIVARGAWHVRVHRVTLDPAAGPLAAVEGSAPLGFVEGEYPQIHSDPVGGWEYADTNERAVGLMRLQGYDVQFRAAAWRGRHDLNSVFPDYVLPLIGVRRLEPIHTLACLVYTGLPLSEIATLNGMISEVSWDDDSSVRVVWADGRVDVVAPL